MSTSNSKTLIHISIFVVTAVVLAAVRVIPHPPNFSPLLAVAIFAGGKATNRWFAYLMPIAALMLSDLKLGIHDLMPVVAVGLILSTFVGARAESMLARKEKMRAVFGWGVAGFLASLVFFVITNFAVWATSSGVGNELGIYPHTFEGLVSCFAMALPFFHNQVLSTWLFLGVFFGVSQFAMVRHAELS